VTEFTFVVAPYVGNNVIVALCFDRCNEFHLPDAVRAHCIVDGIDDFAVGHWVSLQRLPARWNLTGLSEAIQGVVPVQAGHDMNIPED
jgi:hypothetical protein